MDNHFVQDLYNKAEVIGKDKKLLLKRLKEGLSILSTPKKFGKYTYDFENKRLVNEYNVAIQWYNNGHTSTGLCRLVEVDKY